MLQEMRTVKSRVYDRSGVYKISMVRMWVKPLANLRMYGSLSSIHRNVYAAMRYV